MKNIIKIIGILIIVYFIAEQNYRSNTLSPNIQYVIFCDGNMLSPRDISISSMLFGIYYMKNGKIYTNCTLWAPPQ